MRDKIIKVRINTSWDYKKNKIQLIMSQKYEYLFKLKIKIRKFCQINYKPGSVI